MCITRHSGTFPPPRILLRPQNEASLRTCRYAMTSPPVIPKDPITVGIQVCPYTLL